MINDRFAEKCRQCTLKHLSTALVALSDAEISDILKRVYFCGNLSHAANHFVQIDEAIAEEMRALRIDAQNDRLEFIMDGPTIVARLTDIVTKVTNYQLPEEKVEEPVVKATDVVEQPKLEKRKCPCHNH